MHKEVFCQYVMKNNLSGLEAPAREICILVTTAPKKDVNWTEHRRVQGDNNQKTRILRLLGKKDRITFSV